MNPASLYKAAHDRYWALMMRLVAKLRQRHAVAMSADMPADDWRYHGLRLLLRLLSDINNLIVWLKSIRTFRHHTAFGLSLAYDDDAPLPPAGDRFTRRDGFTCDPPPRIRVEGGGETRSLVFLNHASYMTYYLSEALRQRGWRAVVASLEPPSTEFASFYHGEDVNLWHPDPETFHRNCRGFFNHVLDNYRMAHICGFRRFSFFQENYDPLPGRIIDPWDMKLLKQRGLKVGWTPVSCHEWLTPAELRQWNADVCDRCLLSNDSSYPCTDPQYTLTWRSKLKRYCDLLSTEGLPPIGIFENAANIYREPLLPALDPNVWSPDLPIPQHFRIDKRPGEFIVFHLSHNHRARSQDGRYDRRGTSETEQAVQRLREEGYVIRYVFCDNLPNHQVRFVQLQADVAVDQLVFGRPGAAGRECMMLGRPTIGYHSRIVSPRDRTQYVEEMASVQATTETIYPVLKRLLDMSEEEREELGRATRKFAVRWLSADACAARYEQVYDRLQRGLPPTAESSHQYRFASEQVDPDTRHG